MKKNILVFALSVVVIVGLLSGATLAWFTATADPIVNEFVAGTVNIQADYATGFSKVMEENWNPGDCTDVDLEIINTGTKSIYLRARVEQRWMPSMLRLLVVYTGKTVQLLAVEWDSTCKGFTVGEGPLATGNLFVDFPSNTAYINGVFTNLSNTDYIQNGTYNTWCLDLWESINKGQTYNVQIFDPMCNPNWYEEVDGKVIWVDIPFDRLVYIINGDFLNRGFTSDDIQDAIWYYTNPDSTRALSAAAQAIVDETEENWELPTNNVTVDFGDDWVLGSDGYYYYTNPIAGTYSGASLEDRTVIFNSKVCLDGALTGNEYQGKVFSMTTFFEAIQSSNNAINDAWPENPFNYE
jgi:predicted ribosomally synthesized peptide with SipW-like signal peptide